MNKLLELIKVHEGTGPVKNGRLMPYEDSEGFLTIGYGRCIELIGISAGEAHHLLANSVNEIEMECSNEFTWFDFMSDVRRAVIVSMVYNLGMAGFKNFKKTIWLLEKKEHYKASVEMMDSKWAEQVGRRAKELSSMLLTGEWL
jgi:lysozyme